MEKLTAHQQEIIENSIWVVNTALKNQGLALSPKTEDLRQSAILYMCEALQRFDPNRKIKWETFAYKNVYLFIKRKHIKEVKKLMLEADYEDLYLQPAPMPLDGLEEYDESKHRVAQIMSVCTPDERLYLNLKLKGYKREEIGKQTGFSQGYIRKCHERIKQKAQERCL